MMMPPAQPVPHDPSAGLTLAVAAKQILEAFAGGSPPPSGWYEVRVAPFEDGTLPTSYTLENSLRALGKLSYPQLDVSAVCVELVWIEPGRSRPARFQAGCVFKRAYR